MEAGDEDAFWSVALDNVDDGGKFCQSHEVESDDSDWEDGSSRVLRYRLVNSEVILEVEPLAASDGIWSPVGADAWYASALLSTLILQSPEKLQGSKSNAASPIARHPLSTLCNGSAKQRGRPFVVLEMGSGAVGLSGFACAAALQQTQGENSGAWEVYLTDNDLPVLQQLKKNVHRNHSMFSLDEFRRIEVCPLDWGAEEHYQELIRRTSGSHIDLVIGSELVYTQLTADVCAQFLLRLLQDHPTIEIWIVQVTDRHGWVDTVLPCLEGYGAKVDIVAMDADIHDMAATMIPMGGTLDRYAYGAFCIRNST